MPYERVDYTTSEGKQSAAYYDAKSQDAWNVFTRLPVALTQDPVTNKFSEWVPTPISSQDHVSRQQRPIPVTVRPIISPLMIIPAGLFGLGMIWLELTFGLK
jgi:hypothetical protein